jgi:hypothetical protein
MSFSSLGSMLSFRLSSIVLIFAYMRALDFILSASFPPGSPDLRFFFSRSYLSFFAIGLLLVDGFEKPLAELSLCFIYPLTDYSFSSFAGECLYDFSDDMCVAILETTAVTCGFGAVRFPSASKPSIRMTVALLEAKDLLDLLDLTSLFETGSSRIIFGSGVTGNVETGCSVDSFYAVCGTRTSTSFSIFIDVADLSSD